MMEAEDVERTNSGVKKSGSWSKISDFSEKVEQALKGSANEESVKKLSEWRPRREEAEGDIEEKTVDSAVIEENKLEEESNGVKEDLKEASRNAAEAGKKAAEKKNPEKEVAKASEEAARPFYSKIAKAFRRFEDFVYRNIVLRFNPYYLDTGDFSVDMKSKGGGEYEMDVKVPDEETREDLKEEFEEKD
jgi:hypothetical protein